MSDRTPAEPSLPRVYWTAFIGLFFDYYDLYLFIYLDRTLTAHFALTDAASRGLQFVGLAGVGLGALVFGYLADLRGRGRTMLAVFAVYVLGIAGLSLAWNFESLLVFRLIASLALGAEWGISHTYLAERVTGVQRYRFSALLQFSILGGLLAALATKYVLPLTGWRVLFAASIVPVVILSLARWKMLTDSPATERRESRAAFPAAVTKNLPAFLLCLALASLTIASGTMNVFYAKELPQSTLYTVLFWGLVAPGMLVGAWLVRRLGVGRALGIYAMSLAALSLVCGLGEWSGRKLAFALGLSLLNGVPFGLMGAFFNEVFAEYRTMLSGAAYNLGRILAGTAPWLVGVLGLHTGDRYFVFTAILAVFVLLVGSFVAKLTRVLK